MKLYYSPGACSLSPHIALREAGLPFDAVLASTKTHQLADGTDFYTLNPKGYVPLLELDNVICTPHCAGSSVESTAESKIRGARHAAQVLRGHWPTHVVNPQVRPRAGALSPAAEGS